MSLDAAVAVMACVAGMEGEKKRAALAPKLTLRPTDDRIVVEPDELRDDVTDAGIVVKVSQTIESKRHLGKTGVVVAVGPGKRNSVGHRIPLVLNVGDRIVFGEFEHREHREDGKRYLIMQEADVCGVLE